MAKVTRQEPTRKKATATSSRKTAAPRSKRNRKRGDRGPAALATILGILLLALVIWLSVDRRFNIKAVRVDGLHTLTRHEILVLAHVEKGRNLFLYALMEHKGIDKRIEAGEPAVDNAHVRIKLPNTLVVRIQEREPFAQLRINGGPLLLVDATGVPYREIPQRDPTLPAIIAPATTAAPTLGKKLDLSVNTPLGAAFATLDALTQRPYFVPLKLREVQVRRDLYVSVVMSDRPMVRIGLPEDLPDKLTKASEAIDSDPVRAQAAEYVDVTLPSKPAIKMKDTEAKPI